MSRKIEKIIADVQAAKKVINSQEDVPYAIRAGRLIQLDAAKEQLPILMKELSKATIPKRLVACFAEGDDIASETAFDIIQNNGISLDANDLYVNIVLDIEPSYGLDRVFRVTQYGLMIQAIKALYREAEITGYALPEYSETICVDFASTLQHVKSCMLSSGGMDLVLNRLKQDILSEVLAYELLENKVPVLVLNAGEAEKPVLSQLFSRAFTHSFSPDDVVTEESIVKIFKTL